MSFLIAIFLRAEARSWAAPNLFAESISALASTNFATKNSRVREVYMYIMRIMKSRNPNSKGHSIRDTSTLEMYSTLLRIKKVKISCLFRWLISCPITAFNSFSLSLVNNPVVKIIVENLEESISKWLYIEYKNLARLVGKENVLFTNIKGEYEYRCMKKITDNVFKESISSLTFKESRLIVLDPDAYEPLKTTDFTGDTIVLIGGIMGDFPPKHRTRLEISSKIKNENFKEVIFRNLGSGQFPIDMAGLVALMVFNGTELEKIDIIYGLEIEVGKNNSIYLPYAYPLIEGKPAISEEEIEYLKKRIIEDEINLIINQG